MLSNSSEIFNLNPFIKSFQGLPEYPNSLYLHKKSNFIFVGLAKAIYIFSLEKILKGKDGVIGILTTKFIFECLFKENNKKDNYQFLQIQRFQICYISQTKFVISLSLNNWNVVSFLFTYNYKNELNYNEEIFHFLKPVKNLIFHIQLIPDSYPTFTKKDKDLEINHFYFRKKYLAICTCKYLKKNIFIIMISTNSIEIYKLIIDSELKEIVLFSNFDMQIAGCNYSYSFIRGNIMTIIYGSNKLNISAFELHLNSLIDSNQNDIRLVPLTNMINNENNNTEELAFSLAKYYKSKEILFLCFGNEIFLKSFTPINVENTVANIANQNNVNTLFNSDSINIVSRIGTSFNQIIYGMEYLDSKLYVVTLNGQLLVHSMEGKEETLIINNSFLFGIVIDSTNSGVIILKICKQPFTNSFELGYLNLFECSISENIRNLKKYYFPILNQKTLNQIPVNFYMLQFLINLGKINYSDLILQLNQEIIKYMVESIDTNELHKNIKNNENSGYNQGIKILFMKLVLQLMRRNYDNNIYKSSLLKDLLLLIRGNSIFEGSLCIICNSTVTLKKEG